MLFSLEIAHKDLVMCYQILQWIGNIAMQISSHRYHLHKILVKQLMSEEVNQY